MSTYRVPVTTRESPDADPRVPAAAAAIVELLNSRPHATPTRPDALDDPGQAAGILGPFGQPVGEPPASARLDRIRALRDDLVAVTTAGTPELASRGWRSVTGAAADLTFRHTFTDAGQPELRQASGDPVVGAIVHTVAELVAAGVWPRIRVCANELCSHVFYDTTRSRTQRWHSYEICGNRTNVAAYRARGRKAAAPD
jgi:predicted RNA-binding Zn ribbon-like protein